MSRAATIRKRAEAQHIVVTCSSGNEYEIGKASLPAMAMVGELAIPKKLADAAIAQPTVEDSPDVAEAKAKAEAGKPDWMRTPALRAEVEQAMGQILGLSEFIRRYVYDPVILPDSEPITDPEAQVHESDITEDVQEITSYISDYSGGAEVADLKPFPGRRVGSGDRPAGEAVRAEAVEPDGAPAQPVREPAL